MLITINYDYDKCIGYIGEDEVEELQNILDNDYTFAIVPEFIINGNKKELTGLSVININKVKKS